jgi:23S rRNA (uridine2552-2'-O)-methyltransferase
MARSRSSRRWLDEHFSDEFVKQAQALGYRSRAVFKLKEIDERDRLLKPGMYVVDLGAVPGGWSQFAAAKTGPQGRIIALDLLPLEAIPGVTFIQGDVQEGTVLQKLHAELAGQKADLVLSDMAPSASGNRQVDQLRAMELAELALDTAKELLKPGGGFVAKLFQGTGFEELLKEVKRSFISVAVRKPKASRSRSREVFVVAKGFRPGA